MRLSVLQVYEKRNYLNHSIMLKELEAMEEFVGQIKNGLFIVRLRRYAWWLST